MTNDAQTQMFVMGKIYRAKFDDFPATGVSGWVVAAGERASESGPLLPSPIGLVGVSSHDMHRHAHGDSWLFRCFRPGLGLVPP